MNIKFDEKAKQGLQELVNNSSEDYVRIKVFYGCGKPAFELHASYKGDEDVATTVDGITFVVDKKDELAAGDIEIKYDKEVYNNGFYVKSL